MVPKRSSHWIIRKRVPKDLLGIIGSTFIQETLSTSDLTIANQRYSRILLSIDKRIEAARKKLVSKQPKSLKGVDIRWVARMWFDKAQQEYEEYALENSDEAKVLIPQISADLAMYKSDRFDEYAGRLQAQVDAILIHQEGFAIKPPMHGVNIYSGSQQIANVDKRGKNIINLGSLSGVLLLS